MIAPPDGNAAMYIDDILKRMGPGQSVLPGTIAVCNICICPHPTSLHPSRRISRRWVSIMQLENMVSPSSV